jgi:SAM-dependent methyltransferase
MTEQNLWARMAAEDPDHSARYAERFRAMRAAGDDLAGEARLIDAMMPRGSYILDAGCGPGRVGALLHDAGHLVVGVDLDPVLIAAAEHDHPGPRWIVGDLAELDLPALGIDEPFDVIVCAGNVMAFLAPSTRAEVLRRLHAHLGVGGRLVIGFGTDRGYEVEQFLLDVDAAGLRREVLLSSWHLHPFDEQDEFLVAILGETTSTRDTCGSTRDDPSR